MSQIYLFKFPDGFLFHFPLYEKFLKNYKNSFCLGFEYYNQIKILLQLEILGTSINNLKLYLSEKVCKEQYNTWNNSQYLKPILNLIFAFMLFETNKLKQISVLFIYFFYQNLNSECHYSPGLVLE